MDPEKPPVTIDDITAAAKELDQVKDGRATQVGIIPWNQYGGANSILTWGYSYGGSFWEKGTNNVTPRRPAGRSRRWSGW